MIKLLNKDCMEVLKEMESNSIDCIITDPPYGVNFKQDFYDDSKEYVFSNIDDWYKDWYRVLKDNTHIFIYVLTKEIHQWINSGIKASFKFRNILTTEAHYIGNYKIKNTFDFKTQHILHFTKGVAPNFNKYDFIPTSESWLKDKRNTNPNPYTYIYPNMIHKSVSFANTKTTNKSKELDRHPNEKNTDLLKFLVGISTKENDIVLDPFMGSGTTGAACVSLNRNFIGIEKDAKYFNIARERIENETN